MMETLETHEIYTTIPVRRLMELHEFMAFDEDNACYYIAAGNWSIALEIARELVPTLQTLRMTGKVITVKR